MPRLSNKQIIETIQKEIDKLIESQTLIIVEGKNDKKALKKLGLRNIVTLSTPLYKVIEIIKDKEIVILTDFDKQGKILYKKIKSDCSQRGIKINDKLRLFLMLKTRLVHIEGLDTYLKNKKEKIIQNKGAIPHSQE
jgi:5S rRNA maturation endonuclease (ribonuclease M5)